MSTFEHDLTKGNIWKQLVWFAVPFFISNLIQSLYSLIDLIILGHFGGTNSISAANIGGQVLVILTNLAAGLSGGGTVMLGNYLGSKRKDKINGAISTLFITLTVMAAAFMVLLFILKQPLLRLLDTPEEAFSQAEQYLFICTLGLLFIYGYNALSAIMRGLGDSRTPMIFVMIAGSYTPICLIALHNRTGYILCALVWSIAILGILLKGLWITCPKWLSSVLYIGMGWLCVLAFVPIFHSLPRAGFGWLLAGGIIYTIGGVIYSLKLPLFNARHKNFGSHEIFHVFIMLGSACHFIVMYCFISLRFSMRST